MLTTAQLKAERLKGKGLGLAAGDGLIKEIKTDKVSGGAFGRLLGGQNLGAFHIKVRFGSDSRNYDFAPLTNKKAEAELIIAPVKAYGGGQG